MVARHDTVCRLIGLWAAVLSFSALSVSCRGPARDSGNLLVNSQFESGLEGWHWLDWSRGWSAFGFAEDPRHGGVLHLPVRASGDERRPTVVWGGVQEVVLPESGIPDCLGGMYRVADWKRDNWKQYLQLVVIDLDHPLAGGGQAQLRYIIDGVSEDPLRIRNARYLFVGGRHSDWPVVGLWSKFAVNPRADFEAQWGYVPGAGSRLRVLLEARFDGRPPGGHAYGDVYYDDLYFGPDAGGRCGEWAGVAE